MFLALSTKKIQVFINNTRSNQFNITSDEIILQEILSLTRVFKRVHQKGFRAIFM